MTLKEKFDVISCIDCDIEFCESPCTMLSDIELNVLEQIADEFAIGFAEYCLTIFGRLNDKEITTEEALEIYKDEKGL